MLHFPQDQLPNLAFRKAVRKPIVIRFCQIHEDFTVETLEGTLSGKKGDYLLVGVENELYACDQQIFHKIYSILPEGE